MPDNEYNYDQHRVTLDDSDRSENTAAALDGYYPLDLQPAADWPGTERNPREQRFNKDAMIEVADTIDRLIGEVGSIDLSSTAGVNFGPDSWQAAVYLRQASAQVSRTVGTYSQELIQNLTTAAQSIRAAAGHYGGAEGANTANITGVDNNLAGSQPPAGQTPNAW